MCVWTLDAPVGQWMSSCPHDKLFLVPLASLCLWLMVSLARDIQLLSDVLNSSPNPSFAFCPCGCVYSVSHAHALRSWLKTMKGDLRDLKGGSRCLICHVNTLKDRQSGRPSSYLCWNMVYLAIVPFCLFSSSWDGFSFVICKISSCNKSL